MKSFLRWICLTLLTYTVAAFISRELGFYPLTKSWFLLNLVLYVVIYNVFDGILLFCYYKDERMVEVSEEK